MYARSLFSLESVAKLGDFFRLRAAATVFAVSVSLVFFDFPWPLPFRLDWLSDECWWCAAKELDDPTQVCGGSQQHFVFRPAEASGATLS